MVNSRYRNAYKEVLEIIKYLPQKDLYKIPKEKIEYLKRNQNIDYNFNYDISIPLEKQNISREANAIILNLFNDYFIPDKQKEKLANILEVNQKKYQEKQREKYNPDNIFNNSEIINNYQVNNEKSDLNKLPTEVHEKNIFMKLIEYFKKFFNK